MNFMPPVPVAVQQSFYVRLLDWKTGESGGLKQLLQEGVKLKELMINLWRLQFGLLQWPLDIQSEQQKVWPELLFG